MGMIGVFLISAATLVLELALVRIFAVQQFYHFAFMAISLALLGAGASGSLLSIWRRRVPPAILSLMFAACTIMAYLIINSVPFDSFSIAWDSRQILFLAMYFLAAAVPFLFAGLLVGGELMDAGKAGGRGSHRIYGANLIGSACGSLGSLVTLAWFGGPGSAIVAALLGIGAGLFFTKQERKVSKKPYTGWVIFALFVFGIFGLFALQRSPDFLKQRLSPYKTLSTLVQAVGTQHTLSVSDATARVDVVESPVIHIMPGLSLFSPAGPPRQAGLLLDGDNLMPISQLTAKSEDAQSLAGYLPVGLAYRLRAGGRTLVLSAGTGLDVLMALASGAQQVTAVEENAHIIEIIRKEYGDFTGGLYSDPRVQVVNKSDRVYARQDGSEQFDLTVLALTDPHRPVTSGAYSLTEEYAYTVEAIQEYLGTLDENGLLIITRWIQTPPSESVRTFATLAAALARSNRDPAQHLVAFRSLRTMTMLVGKRPFTAAELQIVRSFLSERGFDAVYLPDIQADELNRFNVLPEADYYKLFRDVLIKPAETFAAYRFDIRPTTDNYPFFFHYFKWRQTPEILARLGQTWQPFGGSGYFVLVALLLLVSAAAIVFIVGPLLFKRRSDNSHDTEIPFWHWRVFLYFASLGLAFLFVEMPLAQQYILILGKPVVALAVIVFAVLFFSGIGSMTSRRWSLPVALVALIVVVAAYPFVLKGLSNLALRWPEWARIVFSVLTLAPLGYLMGLPFAGGLRVVERHDAALVPWAWAINGSFSVISSVLAVMIALTWGFATVLWLGAAVYGLALVTFGRLR
jgi:hypothetical protein